MTLIRKYQIAKTIAIVLPCTTGPQVQSMTILHIQDSTRKSRAFLIPPLAKSGLGICSLLRQRGRVSCRVRTTFSWLITPSGQLEPLNLAAGKLDFDGLDPDLGMHLLSIYWSRQLYTAQITYRPVFMRDMACNGPYFSKLLLNAILFTVSKHCPRPELRSDPDDITTAGWRFRQRFTELLRESFDKSEITTLQALLIMSNSLFSRCDERSLSWLYAGNAFNMIIDLGLHVLPSQNKMSAEELEVRKRVLWGAYSKSITLKSVFTC